jgi:hypothetical protein
MHWTMSTEDGTSSPRSQGNGCEEFAEPPMLPTLQNRNKKLAPWLTGQTGYRFVAAPSSFVSNYYEIP